LSKFWSARTKRPKAPPLKNIKYGAPNNSNQRLGHPPANDALPEQLFVLFVENPLARFIANVRGGEMYVGELWTELKRTKPRKRCPGRWFATVVPVGL
jgi:hypothetical protein